MSDSSPAPTPARGIYGFVLFLGSTLGALLYLVWAYTPISWMETVGIYYLPQKYWAVAIPVYFMIGVLLFGCCFYPGLCLMTVKPLNSMDVITDKYALPVKPSSNDYDIPPIGDIPLHQMCQVLYDNSD